MTRQGNEKNIFFPLIFTQFKTRENLSEAVFPLSGGR